MSTIDDGTGTGKQAKIGLHNRVHTHSLVASDVAVATINGNVFEVNSTLVTLTSANESGILYIKNNEDKNIAIIITHVHAGTSTGGTGSGLLHYNISATTGTLISNAVDAAVYNRKIGDNNLLIVDAFTGVEGDTVTDGNVVSSPIFDSEEHDDIYVLPKAASIALSYTPPVGNTSQQIQMNFVIIKDYDRYTIE